MGGAERREKNFSSNGKEMCVLLHLCAYYYTHPSACTLYGRSLALYMMHDLFFPIYPCNLEVIINIKPTMFFVFLLTPPPPPISRKNLVATAYSTDN